jgi:hypothetical protein
VSVIWKHPPIIIKSSRCTGSGEFPTSIRGQEDKLG